MRRPRLSIDRLTDYHLCMAFSLVLALVGIGWLVLLTLWADSATAPRFVGWVLLGGAAALAIWAIADRRAERRRRAALDRVVDEEMSGKWSNGFARIVGAYEKPWYLLCGETGVGKTAALRGADLPTVLDPSGLPVTDPSQGINGTFMFDWWFFRDAVLLDSAGDLIENPDQRWTSFLERMRDARPMQPINGMLLAVSATDLLSDSAGLRRKARLLARQVEVARTQLRVRFPLYLLITKADLIEGFAGFFATGGAFETRRQIIGWSSDQDPRTDSRSVDAGEVRAGMQEMIEGLRDRRPSLLSQRLSRASAQSAKRIDRLDEMFLLPDAITGLLGGLETFVDELLARTGGASPPFLRGVYLTSAGDPTAADSGDAPRRPSQACFLHDLLTEKVFPEAGMVTPLEDVLAGVRRRGRMLVTSAVAATLLIALVSVTGYLRVADRLRPHREFWGRLAERAKTNQLSTLALFDPAGHYQGDRPALPGMSVLDFQTRGADLSDEDASSWLLPLSKQSEAKRLAAHRMVFQELVLLPSLAPPPNEQMPPAEGPPPPSLVGAVVPFVRAGSTVSIDQLLAPATELVKLRALRGPAGAAADLDPAQLQRLTALLRRGVLHAGGDDAQVAVPVRQRQRAAELLERWLKDSLRQQRSALDAWTRTTAQSLAAARSIVDQEERLLARTPDLHDDHALTEALGGLARDEDLGAWDAGRGMPLGESALKWLELPQSLAELRAQFGRDPSVSARRLDDPAANLVAEIDGYEMSVVRGARTLAAALGAALPENGGPLELRQSVAESMAEFDRLHLGPGRPRLLKRCEQYAHLHQLLEEASAPIPPSTQIAENHPFFRLEPALTALRDRIARERAALLTTPFGPQAADDPRSPAAQFDLLSRRAIERAGAEASAHIWQCVLDRPEQIFVWVSGDASGPRPGLTEPHSADPVRSVLVDANNDPNCMRTWLAALSSAEQEVGSSGLDDPAAARAKLAAIAAMLQKQGEAYVEAWQGTARRIATPNLQHWEDLARFTAQPPEIVQARLNQALDGPRAALGILAEQDRFATLKQAAARALVPLNDRALPPTAAAVVDWLKSCDPKSPAATRTALLSDRRTLDQLLPQAALRGEPGASAVQDFWGELTTRTIDAMVADLQPAALERLRRMHEKASNCFPLYRSAAGGWDADDLGALRDDLDALRPAGSEQLGSGVARRIRDLDVVTETWGTYLGWLRRLDRFLIERSPWNVEISKANRRGTWEAVSVRQAGAPQGGEFEQMYLSSEHPPVFTIDGGSALRAGIQVATFTKLKRDGGVETANFWIGGPDVAWPLLRQASAHGSEPVAFPITENNGHGDTRMVQVRVWSTPSQDLLHDMPDKLPDLPDAHEVRAQTP